MSGEPRTAGSRPALDALLRKRSYSRVTDEAPDRAEIEELISAMSHVSDHSGLRPWRVIELRGDARDRLGDGLAEASGSDPEKYRAKARRAPLVLAVVVVRRESAKVPAWEQEAAAAGVGHFLTLLLHDAGWGAIWRTGTATRSEPVREAMRLGDGEDLLGWIYVGGIPERADRAEKPRKPIDLERHLTTLE